MTGEAARRLRLQLQQRADHQVDAEVAADATEAPCRPACAFQSNVTSTPLSFEAPALMYDTLVAVAPPVEGLRMMRWHASFATSNVGLLSGSGTRDTRHRPARRDHSVDDDAIPVDAAREPREQRMLPARLEQPKPA